MNVKKFSRRKRSALVAAVTLPLLFGFSTCSAAPDPPSGEQPAPPTNGQTAPPTNEQTAPPTNEQTAPPTNEQTAPPTNEQTAPPTNEQSAPPTNEQAAPPTNGQSAPPTNEQTAPPTNEQSAPPTNEQSAPPTNGQSAPPTNEQSAPPTNEQTAPPTNEQSAPPTNEQSAPPTNGQSAPPTNEQTAPPTNDPFAPPQDGSAEEPYRSQVDATILEYMRQFEGKTIVDIEFEGASSVTAPTVRAAVLENVGDTFSGAAALRDRNALINTGYFYEAYQTFEVVPEGVIITFHVLENPVLTDVVYSGNTLYSKEELDELMTVKRGEILNSNTLHDNISAIQEDYHREGFILMKIVDMNIDREGVLTLKINEGTLEGYAVKGNKKTKDKVILREMRQEVGTPFNAKLARRSMQRVYNLGFFEDVNVKMVPGVEPNAIVMEINVKEKRTGTFGIGAGYSTSDGIVGMISLSDTNFRGLGETVSIMYERSGDENDAQGYTFTYMKPWIDRHETGFKFQIYNRTYAFNDYNTSGDFLEEYMRKYSGGEITISRPVSEYSTNYFTIRTRTDRYVRHVSSGDAGNRSTPQYADWRKKNFGLTRSLILEHVTDTRDNVYNPTEGNRVRLTLEAGGIWGGDFTFQKASIDHELYRRAGDHDQIWAMRAAYGFGHGKLTEFNQFRLGGQGSLRGYRDDQFRGDRMFLSSIEYRFPLAKKIQGALFADWGGAWNTGVYPKNLKGALGIGVALNTPMGPLRLDYGRGSQGGRFHFSVGGMF